MSQQGPKWAWFRWLRLQNRDGSQYMHRLRMVQTPWFGVYLHWIYSPDDGRDLHDHPWWFVSFLLRGSYVEECGQKIFDTGGQYAGLYRWTRKVSFFNSKRPTSMHRVSSLSQRPVITLVISGPRCRKWGFIQPTGNWVVAEDYFAAGKGTTKV